MENTDEMYTLVYNVTYHVIEIGRYIVNFMVSRVWRDTLAEHKDGHVPDPDNCPYCRYERDVVEPRDAQRARDAFRVRRTRPHPCLSGTLTCDCAAAGGGRDEVDGGGPISQ